MNEVATEVPYERVQTMSAGRAERMQNLGAKLNRQTDSVRPPIDQQYSRYRAKVEKIDLPQRMASYSEAVSIRNHTDREIAIRGRDGTIIHLRPEIISGNYPKGIYYTVGFRRAPHVLVDTDRHDGCRNLITGRLLNSCKPAGKSSLDINDAGFWYRISIDDITQRGGTVYLDEIDKLLSIMDDQFVPEHPFTLTGVDEVVSAAMAQFTRNSAGLMAFIIDNEGEFGRRYINLNGSIMTLEPMTNAAQASGVYVKMAGKTGGNKQGLQFYEFATLNEKCPIKLYRTIGEAEQHGSEVEAKRAELETTKLERELEIVQATTEQKQVSLQRADQKDRLDLVSLQRKDHFDAVGAERKDTYDQRSTERKDESEENKAALAAAGGIIAIAGVGWKVLSSGRKAMPGVVGASTLTGASQQLRLASTPAILPTLGTGLVRDTVRTKILGVALGDGATHIALQCAMKLIGG